MTISPPRSNQPYPAEPQIVPYLDLGGGLDTANDAHALERNQLSQSINCWYAYGKSISKRPGSTAFIAAASTGAGGVGSGIVTARFNNATYVVVQVNGNKLYAARASDTTWTLIGTMTAGCGPIQAAQMYDGRTTANELYIVNGVDFPLVWQGPGTMVVSASSLTGAQLPLNMSGSAIITPSYVTTFQNFLLYAGEPTAATAVYRSDAFFPNNFTTPASLIKVGTDPNYEPYFVGLNDGINGGNITGLMSLEQGILIFKQAAIYSFTFTSLYGDVIFYPQLVSASIGCLSPRSIVKFDGFGIFLGIDGVYSVSLSTPPDLISEAIATYFDSSFSGYPAIITNNATAVAVRHGGKYLIWFTSNQGSYPNDTGIWFNFRQLDAKGKPTAGEIQGMFVGGAAPLRGPGDDGNFVWVDASFDRVSKFGYGFSDALPGATGYGNPITASFSGKSDFLEDVFPGDGPLRPKTASKVWLVLGLFGHLSSGIYSGSLTFNAIWYGGGSLGGGGFAVSNTIPVSAGSNSVWGSNWGTMTWSASSSTSQPYAFLCVDTQAPTIANNVQIGFNESSTNGWVVIGYFVEIAARQPLRASNQSL